MKSKTIAVIFVLIASFLISINAQATIKPANFAEAESREDAEWSPKGKKQNWN